MPYWFPSVLSCDRYCRTARSALIKRPAYREHDYSFGQVVVSLRTATGLTQAALADRLGVSRRAVGAWEAGSKYPNATHLKQFIALAVEHHAFARGLEAEQIRSLWQAAHQKVILDESWLAAILSPAPAEPKGTQTTPQSGAGPRLDWSDALAVPSFYGREWELRLLTDWVLNERCRVVSVVGLGGIGKSALAVSLMQQLAPQFDVVIWRSLRDMPTCEVLLDECLQVLVPASLPGIPASLERRLNLLLQALRSTRALLVFDNVESVLEQSEGAGRTLPDYAGLERFLQQSAETEHKSCVLLTSREKLAVVAPPEGTRSRVRALRLARLDSDACERLFEEKNLAGTPSERARLMDVYDGNPLALRIVAQTIVELFDGLIGPFLEHGEVIFGGVRELLAKQFNRLSTAEQSVLLWLAIMREPSTLDDLQAVLVTPLSRARLLEVLEVLHRHSLIERGQKQGSFTLQSVVLEYATARLIAEVSEEIQNGTLTRLLEHGLELAHASEYVRQTQERLIVAPILANLRSGYPQEAAMEEHLLALLRRLTTLGGHAQGYGPANLAALLRLQRGNLRGLALSQLALRGAYLQGIDMQDASLSETLIQDSTFTETFDAMTAVAISRTGNYWAASSRHGEIRVWAAGGRTLLRTWRAHGDMIWTLAFSPDGRTLASGSWDGLIKLWDADSGALRWSAFSHMSTVRRVAFAPDGSVLASTGGSELILWDTKHGKQLWTLPHPVPTPGLAWSPDGRLIATGDGEGSIRLWEMQKTGPPACVQTLASGRRAVTGLDFAPDGGTLAAASWDGTVKLWEVPSGRLRHTLTGHADRVTRLAWNPDGRTLASCSRDQQIWLWDAEQRRYQTALRGHTAEVWSLAFTPDSRSLLSSSEDGTLRIWDIANGRCVRVLEGCGVSVLDVDWSPDGTQLVSGGSDALVTVWSVDGGTPPRVLRGSDTIVTGVGWSSNGRWLASSEWNSAIRLWDPTSGTCLQVIRPSDNVPNFDYGLAWSPDGRRLASGTFRRGVQVIDVMERSHRSVERQFPSWIHHPTWSPAGGQLAGVGDDGAVYVWDAEVDTLLQRLLAPFSTVKSLAWSPDGTHLASVGNGRDGGELFVWDVRRGERVYVVAGLPWTLHAVVWGPSDELLVTGGDDGTLRWWNVQGGECVQVREAHQGTVRSLRRSPDGTKLASCGDDGAIMLWDLHSGAHIRTLRRDRPYERLNITGIRGVTEAQKAMLRTLGAIEDDPAPAR